jgi:hypothetical protein
LVAKLLVVALVAWFIRETLSRAWLQIAQSQWHFSAAWLTASAGFYLLGLLPAGWFWHRVLRDLGQETGLGETLRAYCIGHLGKYVPGKAMVVVLRAGLVRSHRVHTGIAAASVFFETLTMMSVGSFIAATVLTLRLLGGEVVIEGPLDPHWLLVGTIGMMLAAAVPTLPPVFRRLARVLGVGKSDPTVAERLQGLGYGTLLTGWVAMTVSWALLGASLWATFRAMGIDHLDLWAQLPEYTAAVALALVAGFLSMIPAGFGVRDLILVALNERFFAVEAGAAVVATALLRIVWLVAELVISAILYVAVRRKPMPSAQPTAAPSSSDVTTTP